MLIKNCELNKTYRIVNIDFTNFKLAYRLCELGFIIGQEIKIIRYSFLKNTYLINIFDSVIALKYNVCNIIEVEE